jgi:H+/Cl- antiporter ClcA
MILLGLLSGASIGRKGPTVHIGAAIMFALGERAHFPKHDIERGLILALGPRASALPSMRRWRGSAGARC